MKEKSRKGAQSQLWQKPIRYQGYNVAIRTGEISQQESAWYYLQTKACAGDFSKCATLSLKWEKIRGTRFHRWLLRTVTNVAVQPSMACLSFPHNVPFIDYGHWTLSLNQFISEKGRSACAFVCLHLYEHWLSRPLNPWSEAASQHAFLTCDSHALHFIRKSESNFKKHISAEVGRVFAPQECKK